MSAPDTEFLAAVSAKLPRSTSVDTPARQTAKIPPPTQSTMACVIRTASTCCDCTHAGGGHLAPLTALLDAARVLGEDASRLAAAVRDVLSAESHSI